MAAKFTKYKYELDDVGGSPSGPEEVVLYTRSTEESHGLQMTRDDARRLGLALLRLVGERPDKVECVDCGEPEEIEAVFCRSCETKNSEARGRNKRRDALEQAIDECQQYANHHEQRGDACSRDVALHCVNSIKELMNKDDRVTFKRKI